MARCRGCRPALAAISLLAVLGAPLSGHDFWIEPSSFRSEVGERIALRLRVGESFHGDPVPRDPAHALRFSAQGPQGEAPTLGFPWSEPAGFLLPLLPGSYLVLYDSGPTELTLDGERFERYLREEGLEWASAERAARGQTQATVRERFFRSAQSVLTVGAPAPPATGAGFDHPAGLRLELLPARDPRAVPAGGELPLQLLYRGRPLAGVLVVAMPANDPSRRIGARTDAEGRVTLRLEETGVWLLKAVHIVAAPQGSGADWESSWASLTFSNGG